VIEPFILDVLVPRGLAWVLYIDNIDANTRKGWDTRLAQRPKLVGHERHFPTFKLVVPFPALPWLALSCPALPCPSLLTIPRSLYVSVCLFAHTGPPTRYGPLF
jgi:hypothetical protein